MLIRDGGHASIASDNGLVGHSVDDNFIYVEADLARNSSSDIDISIQQSRAFVRIERLAAGTLLTDEVDTGLSAIFGWVEFSQQGATIRAILTLNGLWSCTVAPDIAGMLNAEFAPGNDFSDHNSVCDVLIKAAERLGGLAWLDPDSILDN